MTTTQQRRKQVFTFAALVAAFMGITVAATAGSKNVKAEIMTAPGTEINSDKPFTVSVKITNNDMMALDMMMDMPTIKISVDGNVVATDTLMLSSNLASGASATLTTKPHTVKFAANKTTAPMCIEAGVLFATNTSTGANPCQNVAMKVFPTGISNVSASNTVSVYPNPATTQVTVKIEETNATMVIYDFTGKAVAQHQLNSNVNTVSVADLAAGNYLDRIAGKNGEINKGQLSVN